MSFKLPLPDNVAKLVDKSQREALGIKTGSEMLAEAEIKSEKELHRQIGNLLRLRGIEFIDSRMDKRTTQRKGVPDFLFAVSFRPKAPMKSELNGDPITIQGWPIAVAWELKLPGRVLDPDQKAMFDRLTKAPNSWCCRVIRSVDEALAELRKLGL